MPTMARVHDHQWQERHRPMGLHRGGGPGHLADTGGGVRPRKVGRHGCSHRGNTGLRGNTRHSAGCRVLRWFGHDRADVPSERRRRKQRQHQRLQDGPAALCHPKLGIAGAVRHDAARVRCCIPASTAFSTRQTLSDRASVRQRRIGGFPYMVGRKSEGCMVASVPLIISPSSPECSKAEPPSDTF